MSSSSLRNILFKLDKCKKLCNDAKQHSNSKTIMMQFHKKSKSNNIHPNTKTSLKATKCLCLFEHNYKIMSMFQLKLLGALSLN
jgi:hypothetical protein